MPEPEKTLTEQAVEKMACSCCGRRTMTREQVAEATGASLRSVVRFLNGEHVGPRTIKRFEDWLATG